MDSGAAGDYHNGMTELLLGVGLAGLSLWVIALEYRIWKLERKPKRGELLLEQADMDEGFILVDGTRFLG